MPAKVGGELAERLGLKVERDESAFRLPKAERKQMQKGFGWF
jgi:hypothetical protein